LWCSLAISYNNALGDNGTPFSQKIFAVKYHVSAIAPFKAGLVLAGVFFLVTLPLLLVAAVVYDLALPQGPAYLLWAMLVIPLVNALFAFFSGFVLALCYNLVAKRWGGFEISLQDHLS
jgi:hypothetical protein